jgi:HipA-like protein
MLSKIKSWFNWIPEELNEVKTPDDIVVVFILHINDLEIGTLTLKEGEWYFKYSEEFKTQDDYKPLINFPNKNKEYSSLQLWPFFASRIPGLGQPIVKDFLHKMGIEKADEVSLLKEFGKRTISNPYVLESV